MADERELVGQDLGVDAGDSTESAQPTAQPVAPPTAPSKVNLDELPEFRRFRSEYDRKLAETERRYQQQLAQQQNELRNRQLSEMDDYQRLEYELNETRQREQMAYQRLQDIETEQAKRAGLERISKRMKVPVDVLMSAQDPEEAYELAEQYAEQLQQQREVERQAQETQRVAERAGKIANNRVDLGSGTPVPTNDWERTYLAAKGRKDSRSLFKLALGEQQEN